MTVTTRDRIIGTREWAGRLKIYQIYESLMEERGREARTHLSFCFAHCAVKLDSTPFQINISESDHMTQTQG